jgi:hypothetical protein
MATAYQHTFNLQAPLKNEATGSEDMGIAIAVDATEPQRTWSLEYIFAGGKALIFQVSVSMIRKDHTGHFLPMFWGNLPAPMVVKGQFSMVTPTGFDQGYMFDKNIDIMEHCEDITPLNLLALGGALGGVIGYKASASLQNGFLCSALKVVLPQGFDNSDFYMRVYVTLRLI